MKSFYSFLEVFGNPEKIEKPTEKMTYSQIIKNETFTRRIRHLQS